MPQDKSAVLTLEIFREADTLRMTVFERLELEPTLRHYSQCRVSRREVNRLYREIMRILSRADREGRLGPDGFSDFKNTTQLLWDHLLTRAVKNRLKSSPAKELILSIDEELANIPWEILFTGEDFLSLKFNLGRLVRTETYPPAQYRGFTGKLRMLVLANPTDDLRSAYLEGAFIKNQLDKKRSDIGVDFKSTRISSHYVKKNLRDYDIVHFSGHCEYGRHDPGENGWLLSDGVLAARDIRGLGQAMPLPDLVFSNACYSAHSPGDPFSARQDKEETGSLAEAFLFSGVRHYVGTIRKVEDQVSLLFANEFYTRLMQGLPIGECMRLARLRLIEEYGKTCISWAGYVLYGDPGFILFRPKRPPAAKRIAGNPAFWSRSRRFLLAAAVVFICAGLYLWVPSINPSSHLLFSKSRGLFARGENSRVIELCARIIEKDPYFLDVYPLLADTYQRLGDKDNALKYYYEYVSYSQKRGDRKRLDAAYVALGWAYQLYGDYRKALEFYDKAAQSSVAAKDKLNEARALRKLAVWHLDKGDDSKALELLTRSSEINRERQHIFAHKYNLACDYFDMGLVFTDKDDFAAAEEFYAKSRSIFEKLKLKDELSDCYFNLGEIYLFEKEYNKAQECYALGLKIDQTQGNKLNLSSDYNMIGELRMAMADFFGAESNFAQAASLAKEMNFPPGLAESYFNLGMLEKRRGLKKKASEYFRQAQEIYYSIDPRRYQKVKEELLSLTD